MTGLPKPSHETKLSGANGDREEFIFPVQLTTTRIGSLARFIHNHAINSIHPIKGGALSKRLDGNTGGK